MDTCKRLILAHVPTSICNFRCHYCYIAHRADKDSQYKGEMANFLYSPEHIAKCFSVERLGGKCYFNFCADGETLLTKRIDEYMKAVVEAGHYAEIVSNMTVTPMINKILAWNRELLDRTEFKASFHWLELKKRNLIEIFTENILAAWEAGASVSVEITPSDELVPYIDEVLEYSQKHFGTKPQLTIARNDATEHIEYLTKMSEEEYIAAWSKFDSPFWEFKRTIFGVKRKEFCYAGVTQLHMNFATGIARACYKANFLQDIYKHPDKPIKWIPIGHCLQPHCYNGHMMLTIGGAIPYFAQSVKYGRDIRDRIRDDGTHWLQPQLLDFFNTSACENNDCNFNAIQRTFAIALNYICAAEFAAKNVQKVAKYVIKKTKRIQEDV